MPRTSNIPVKVIVVLISWLALAACHRRVPVTPPAAAPEAAPPAPPGPPVCKLTAEPAAVEQGKSVTLSWTTQNATDVAIDQGIGKQLTQGSVSASPQSSTTYILTASGAGGSATCTARVTVTPTPPATPSVSEENLNAAGSWTAQVQDAFFDYDSAELRQDAQQVLTADANLLKAHPGAQVTVEGYCDQRGSEEYNLGLGQRRAAAARDFLVNLGIPADSLSTVSYGKDRLSCSEDTEDCWQKNRRVHLRFK
jgi:peptidoglycan-associated lipoprotein